MNLILIIFCHLHEKKTGIRLQLLNDIDILLMVEKGNRDGICHARGRYAKRNNEFMKNYDKNIELSYLTYLDANNLYGWAMSQKLSYSFKWIKKLSEFNGDFIKNYDEKAVIRDIFLKQMLSMLKSRC